MNRDLDDELGQCPWFLEKIRTRKDYAQNVYAALCNMRWQPAEVLPILKDEYWTCSWRSAGGIVADFRNTVDNDTVEDYMDWYCSGIQDFSGDEADPRFNGGKFVPEGVVTDEIREDFATLGWHPSPWPKDKD
jgi:hypothetical protein